MTGIFLKKEPPKAADAETQIAPTSPSLSDTQRLDWMEYRHAYIYRTGYRGRGGFTIVVGDPGGHYQEEGTREIGHGMTIREAIDNAITEARDSYSVELLNASAAASR